MELTPSDIWDTTDETGYADPSLYDRSHGGSEELDPSEHEEEVEEDGEEAVTVEPKFANVVDWVEGWFLPVIRRKITNTSGSGLSWDARWWAYPEVVARLTALHYAWKEARASDSMSAMSAWWIHHLEAHLRVILDGETGPMANADKSGSWMGWPAMPGASAPADVFDLIVPLSEEP